MEERARATPESGPDPTGLGPDSRALYAALLELGGDAATVRTQAAAGIDVDAALAVLSRLRLIHRVAGADHYEAVSPSEAAEEVVGPQEAAAYAALRESAQLRRTMRDLGPLYRAASRGTEVASSSEILRSGQEVNDRLQELLPGVRRAVSSAHPTMAPPEVLEGSLESDGELLSRGIEYRQLFTHTARRYHLSMTYLRTMQRLGAEVRTAALIPSRMILIDDQYALLPVSSGDAVAAIVRDPPVIGYLHEFFTFLWERGQPLTGEEESEDRVPQEVEVAILRELAEGRTDEAIARRLGISSRTLRRYLSGMFANFGVDTRFQLGMAAVRQGIISESDGDGDC
ncbi:MAG: helix-turn-helix transcriptional regulator [Tetrasphaera sp.]